MHNVYKKFAIIEANISQRGTDEKGFLVDMTIIHSR